VDTPGAFVDRLGFPEPGLEAIHSRSGVADSTVDGNERGMPRRWAGVIIGLVVLATCGYVLHAGHQGQRGDDLLREAETASNRGDYASAVLAFHRFTTEYPNHSEADDALYRLGFINRHFLNDPEAALTAYRRLVQVHGNGGSQWVGLAMREIADIHRSQQQYNAALEEYESINAQFGGDPQVRANTALEIARTWYEMGEPTQVRAACQEVLEQGADEAKSLERQRIEALQLLAQSILDLEGKPRDAVEAYKLLIQSYPNSPAAKDAQKELAYIRSVYPDLAARRTPPGPRTERRPEPAPRASSSGAVLVDLPRNPVSGASDSGMYDCLAVLCEAAGQVVSPAKLAGFSSQPFAFFYGGPRTLAGPYMAIRDPIVTAAERVGLPRTRLISSPSIDLGLTNLKSQLHGGNAVMVPLALSGTPSWRIVRGYDPQRGEFYLYSASSRYDTVSGEEFRKAWQSPVAPAVVAPGNGAALSMYVVSGPAGTCEVKSAVESSVADAIDLMRGGSEVGGQRSGVAALEDLTRDLAGLADGSLSDTHAKQLADWCGRPLRLYTSRREAAADYLEMWRETVFEPGAEQESVTEAISLLRDSARLLKELGVAYGRAREGTGPVEGGGSPQDIARSLAEVEGRIADALEAAL
jgi:TolA-binding protein